MSQPTLEETVKYFIEVAEAAVANHRRKPGGQQVQYFDDFAQISPSIARNLEWWVERFKLALNQPKCQCQWEAGDSSCKVHGEECI